MPTILYNGTNFTIPPNLGLGTPGVRRLAYGQLPTPFSAIPPQLLAAGAGTGTLNTNNPSGANTGYGGYTNYDPTTLNLLPSFTTNLDANTGFTVAFTLQIAAETSNPNRAGFSLTVTSSNQTGIELGFRTNQIFAQSSNFIETSNSLLDTTVSRNYTLQVVNGAYTLRDGGTIVGSFNNQPLINYNFNPATSTPPLPFNPYTSPNFLFFGDNTDQGNANFTISNITVNALPVANPESYQTPANTILTVAAPSGVLANDPDADGDPVTAVLVTPPSLGSLALNPNGSFTYTPNAGVNGVDSFQYRVNDGTADSRDVVTTTLTIGNPPSPTPISPELLKLLQNPLPPPVPAPVIVGTLPSLETPPTLTNSFNTSNLLGFPTTPISGTVNLEEEIVYYGTPEDDVIVGTAKREAFFGFGKKDLLRGGNGVDRFFGGRGADTIFGGKGNDFLRGGRGHDFLHGGVGDDILNGNKGKNTLTGGAGRDRFQLGKGQDLITDFVMGEDELELVGGLSFADLVITQGTGAAVLSLIPNALRPNFQAIAALVGITPSMATNFIPAPLGTNFLNPQ
jgi:Ca2+-binding RTX toxin-like protein